MPRSELSTREVKEIQSDMDFWKALEHRNWKLISFTERTQARYGWIESQQYKRYVTITKPQIEFFRGLQEANISAELC